MAPLLTLKRYCGKCFLYPIICLIAVVGILFNSVCFCQNATPYNRFIGLHVGKGQEPWEFNSGISPIILATYDLIVMKYEKSYLSIGFGGGFGRASFDNTLNQAVRIEKHTLTYIPVFTRIEYHHDWGYENFDVFGGVSIGGGYFGREQHATELGKTYIKPEQGVYFVFGPYLGASYYFANTVGVVGSFGFGASNINLGLSYRF